MGNRRKSSASSVKFKVILLGDQGVGKTSFFFRIKENVFHDPKNVTLGLDMCVTKFNVDGAEVEITLCDTAGSERYRTLTRNFYRNAQAVLFMFSVDDPSSLYRLMRWDQDARDYAPTALRFLVGNKSDLAKNVPDETVASFASAHNCESAFTNSARTGAGASDILPQVAERLLTEYKQSKAELEGSWLEETVNIYKGEEIPGHHPQSSRGCC